jgi:sulfopyruvate decarboxylase subunit beta
MGMLRTEAVDALAAARGPALTVVTMQAVAPWNALRQADERNFNVTGCMGSAASIGLGLALARRTDRVVVVDGDGSLLMQLGSLVTIGGCAPQNLCHVVMENGTYETSGNQLLPSHGAGNLVELARAAGYRSVHRFDSRPAVQDGLADALFADGPVFVSLVIHGPGTVATVDPAPVVERKPEQIETMRVALTARTH